MVETGEKWGKRHSGQNAKRCHSGLEVRPFPFSEPEYKLGAEYGKLRRWSYSHDKWTWKEGLEKMCAFRCISITSKEWEWCWSLKCCSVILMVWTLGYEWNLWGHSVKWCYKVVFLESESGVEGNEGGCKDVADCLRKGYVMFFFIGLSSERLMHLEVTRIPIIADGRCRRPSSLLLPPQSWQAWHFSSPHISSALCTDLMLNKNWQVVSSRFDRKRHPTTNPNFFLLFLFIYFCRQL